MFPTITRVKNKLRRYWLKCKVSWKIIKGDIIISGKRNIPLEGRICNVVYCEWGYLWVSNDDGAWCLNLKNDTNIIRFQTVWGHIIIHSEGLKT